MWKIKRIDKEKELLEPINNYSKIVEYKINILAILLVYCFPLAAMKKWSLKLKTQHNLH